MTSFNNLFTVIFKNCTALIFEEILHYYQKYQFRKNPIQNKNTIGFAASVYTWTLLKSQSLNITEAQLELAL